MAGSEDAVIASFVSRKERSGPDHPAAIERKVMPGNTGFRRQPQAIEDSRVDAIGSGPALASDDPAAAKTKRPDSVKSHRTPV
jgi:hypothetical protein